MKRQIFDRTIRLIGEDGVEKLRRSRVLVFGLGGVGSYVCEGLVRAGVGSITIVDRDIVDITNINRQLIALTSTVGKKKTDVTRARLLDINPDLKVISHFLSFDQSTAAAFDFTEFDYIVDAIDSQNSKVLIALMATKAGTPLLSCMGTGFRLDPSKLKIEDIFATSGCPLARQMRKILRQNGINSLKVLYSTEAPITPKATQDSLEASPQTDNQSQDSLEASLQTDNQSQDSLEALPQTDNQGQEDTGQAKMQKTIASISFVPSVAGLMIAAEVTNHLISPKQGTQPI